MITINSKTAKALVEVVPKKDVRYYLIGAYVDPAGYIVATDGHCLIAIKCEVDPHAPYIIPRDVLADIAKSKQTATVTHTLVTMPGRTVSYTPVEGTYPQWRRVIPREYSGEAAYFDPALLTRCNNAARALEDAPRTKVYGLTLNGLGAALVDCKQALIVVMPGRYEGPTPAGAAQRVREFLGE